MGRRETRDSETVKRFSHAGFECMIKQPGRTGYWCGYVNVPEGAETIRWRSEYREDLDTIIDADVDVWGGVTYGPGDDGWVGFDDNHAAKLVEHTEFTSSHDAVKNETQRFAEQIRSLLEQEREA